MNCKILRLIVVIILFITVAYPASPKREFRAAWIATVVNLDWPSSRYATPGSQQQDLINLLELLKNAGINAVLLQIRTECDALYASSYEPWSYWLTGTQGTAPSPYYDPLHFAIEEAHKRNMELHAWFNPYRAERQINSYTLSNNHVVKTNPDWILTFSAVNLKLLNPGLAQVRDYVTAVVMDVVNNYDIDGVHFDDYFYPYPNGNFTGITNEDDATYAADPRGFSDRGAWRRDNVNLLVAQVYDSIHSVKKHVRFGISPFGIWKSGVPSGIVGLDAYSQIYCDAVYWLSNDIVDYLTPQLYWSFGGGQDYGKLMPWWASQTDDRPIIPGHALYKAGGWPANEIPSQIRLNRSTAHVSGSVFFRARHVQSNILGVTDSLRDDLYYYPSIMPEMPWLDSEAPSPPQNLTRTIYPNMVELNWQKSPPETDGDTAGFYVVYRFDNNEAVDFDDVSKIMTIARGNIVQYQDKSVGSNPQFTYYVSALDRLHNESVPSGPITTLENPSEIAVSDYDLKQNYPNPFNPVTYIDFALPAGGWVQLRIYDVLGRMVMDLVNEKMVAGRYQKTFDASALSSGTYVYILQAGDFRQAKKMVVIK